LQCLLKQTTYHDLLQVVLLEVFGFSHHTIIQPILHLLFCFFDLVAQLILNEGDLDRGSRLVDREVTRDRIRLINNLSFTL
jgi:hypothetical protein